MRGGSQSSAALISSETCNRYELMTRPPCTAAPFRPYEDLGLHEDLLRRDKSRFLEVCVRSSCDEQQLDGQRINFSESNHREFSTPALQHVRANWAANSTAWIRMPAPTVANFATFSQGWTAQRILFKTRRCSSNNAANRNFVDAYCGRAESNDPAESRRIRTPSAPEPQKMSPVRRIFCSFETCMRSLDGVPIGRAVILGIWKKFFARNSINKSRFLRFYRILPRSTLVLFH
jgi:hypothetical protein